MEDDDPRTPLLGVHGQSHEGGIHSAVSKLCSTESWRRRFPITIWLPHYSFNYLLRDAIAGITVGLTSIPQGIAYAIVAGLPPQVGLYSSIFPGLVYMLFGSCKDVTVGPTAILAALLAKYVALSADFAYLAAFLSGCLILLMGVLQLGFLLDFISRPVISGFTTAAALQIGASQLKSLLRISGSSGHTFIDAIINLFKNLKTVQLWDTVLGVVSIIILLLFKKCASVCSGGAWCARARNALVVCAGAALAAALHARGLAPFALTGKIEGGLPDFGPPPFTTVVNNKTLYFDDMLNVFGPQGFVMPLVAILESIAIAKAFSGGAPVDATQEMIAIGLCNVAASLAHCMPATGSFTRTALNHASGVATPAGSLFKASLVLLAVTLLSDAFYFIPRATLAAVIMVAMVSIVELSIIGQLWRNSKLELAVYAATLAAGAALGLEYGIAAGAAADALRALAAAARPALTSRAFKVGNVDCLCVTLPGALQYASAVYTTQHIQRCGAAAARLIVLDARQLQALDIGVAESLISTVLELEGRGRTFLLWNFSERHRGLLEDLRPGFVVATRFVAGPSIDHHVLNLELNRTDPLTVNNY